jgi:carboxylesterase
MGEYLNQHGYTCLGIRLAGHATRPEDMIRSRWTDWTTSVEDGYQLLHGVADHIFLIGLSMGGVLALLMSTRLSPRVEGVVAMSTPSRLPTDYPTWFIQLMSNVMRYRPKSNEPPGSGWFDQAAYKEHVSYPQNPVRSAAELKKLILSMRLALPKIDVPVLLIHSKDEKNILPDNLEYIYEELANTSDKTKLYLTGSGHVIPRDASRQQAFQATLEFIQRVDSQK